MKMLCRNPKCAEFIGLNNVYCSILCEQEDPRDRIEQNVASGYSPCQRYERGSILVTTNLTFGECTEAFGSERLTHHAHILEMNGESYRLQQSGQAAAMVQCSSAWTNLVPCPVRFVTINIPLRHTREGGYLQAATGSDMAESSGCSTRACLQT